MANSNVSKIRDLPNPPPRRADRPWPVANRGAECGALGDVDGGSALCAGYRRVSGGAFLAALFPVALAFAVSPDWSAVLWTVALFVSVEAVTPNVVGRWLYASHTGVSPLSIIISAMFWTFIWGPMGVVMAMPLTVCLVVLGRHVPQFELFCRLLGREPVLAPCAGLYQRLLAGDAPEVISRRRGA